MRAAGDGAVEKFLSGRSVRGGRRSEPIDPYREQALVARRSCRPRQAFGCGDPISGCERCLGVDQIRPDAQLAAGVGRGYRGDRGCGGGCDGGRVVAQQPDLRLEDVRQRHVVRQCVPRALEVDGRARGPAGLDVEQSARELALGAKLGRRIGCVGKRDPGLAAHTGQDGRDRMLDPRPPFFGRRPRPRRDPRAGLLETPRERLVLAQERSDSAAAGIARAGRNGAPVGEDLE